MKKFISFLLCVLLLTALVIPASASGEAFVVTPSTVTVKPGGTITLNVAAGNAPECVSFAVGIQYDKSVFKVTGISPAENPGGFLTGFTVEEAPRGIAALNYEKNQEADAVAMAPTGSVGTITLKVSDDAEEGDYTITCEAQTIPNVDTSEGTAATVNSVMVTVRNVTMGDVSKDGKLSLKDCTLLQQYVANKEMFDLSKIDLTAADVTNDGKISLKDCTKLQQMVASEK